MMKKSYKSSNEISFLSIAEYYKTALILAKSGRFDLASKKIYMDMPVKLYDLSIDILDNSNGEFSNEELRNLIKKVDKMLTDHSEKAFDEPEVQEDKFSDKTF